MYRFLLFLHILSAMVWIGGMVFNLFFLHPALKGLPQKDRAFVPRVLRRFFLAVWLSIAILLLTGMYMWHSFRTDLTANTLFHIKLFLFGIMTLNFLYIYFWLFKRNLLGHIPNFVGINLLLGVLITLIITHVR